jgi:ABC-type glycerol-3-phosphate transport system substrate-binding protein
VKFVNVWGGSRIPLMDALIADFEALYPDIDIQSELIAQAGMNERYLTSIASGTPDDVIMMNRSELPYYASQNALTPLDDFLKRDGINLEETYYASEIPLSQWDGVTYALPNTTAAGFALLFYNKTMLAAAGFDPEKPPKTWQELAEMNQALLREENGDLVQVGFSPSGLANEFYTLWLGANNGRLLSEDLKSVMLNTPEAKGTLQWLVSQYEQLGGIERLGKFFEYVDPSGGGINRYDRISNQSGRVAFYNQKQAFQFEGVWGFFSVDNDPPVPLNYGVTTVPYNAANPDASSTVLVDGGWAYAIPKGAKNVAAAWEWVKYTCAGEGSRTFFQAQNGRPTPIISVNTDPWYAENNPHWATVVADLENSTYSPPLPVSGEIKKAINDALEPVLYRERSVDEALRIAQQDAQRILDEYWANQ